MRKLLCAAATVLVAALTASAPAGAAEPPATLSSAEKQALMLDVLERFVPHAEAYWRASDLSEPRTGYFAAVGPGVTQPRGAGNIAMAYATLLGGRPDQPSFGGVDRGVMLEHAIQAIRHEALTSKLSGAGYDRWGSGTWQASLETYGWGYAAQLLWDRLDADTRALVERVVTGEADILLTKPIESGTPGNTAAEDAGWNAPTPALAAVLFPDHEHRAAWEEKAKQLALNAHSREADETAGELVDGRPLSDWMVSVNVNPDLTMENHGFFNPIYQQVVHVTIGEAAMIYGQAGHPLPEAFSFRTEEIWDSILGPLAADDGDLIMTAGQDWTSKDYQHLDYLTVLATRFGRADASVAESRALQLVARRQATHPDGSILGQPQLGYESMLVKRLSAAWWNHELFGPAPQPTAEEYEAERERTGGVRRYPYVDIVQARQRDAFASMSWSGAQSMGLVVPSARGHEEDPILVAYTPRSLVGAATGAVGPYACDCRDDFFSTAGSIGTRRFSMTAFPDGTTLLLDRGEGSTFNVGFERIPGLTGERPVFSEAGEGLGDLPGAWANVADRLGMVVAGGGGLRARDVTAANPYRLLEGSAATGSGNRGALVLPLAEHGTTERLAASVHQPATPEEWSALYGRAADGTGRVAVARWGGPAEAELALADARGGPVTTVAATVEGDEARGTWTLDAPASTGEVVRFFVRADAPVRTRALDSRRAELVNDRDAATRVTVTYVTEDGRELTAERVLAAGEATLARLAGGRLIAAGPEYEPLTEARERIAALRDDIAAWQADGTIDRGTALWLTTTTGLVAHEIDRALEAATAARPDTARAARATQAARALLVLLRTGDRAAAAAAGRPDDTAVLVRRRAISDPVAERLAAERSAVGALLDRALEEGLTVVARLDLLDTLLPGEDARVRVTILNRSADAATGGRLELEAPGGWTVAPDTAPVATVRPGETRTAAFTVQVSSTAAPGDDVTLRAALAYRRLGRPHTATASVDGTVRPVLALEPVHAVVPLAAGGYNRPELRIANRASRTLTVDLTAAAPDGITAELDVQRLELAPGEERRIAIALRNTGPDAGTSELAIAARTGSGAAVRTAIELRHSRNLALNGLGAPWPAASASGSQEAFPPALATDGAAGTFWVSDGTQRGDGPSPERPKLLTVDFGAPVQIAEVRMVPRTGYGPRAYAIEASDDGAAWRQVASVPAAPNGPVTTAIAPTTARALRLRITDSHDAQRPPRNVQVAELEVR
jgi:hypothetical protein